jgi:hypothetical protein
MRLARAEDVPSPLLALTGIGNDQEVVRAFRVVAPADVSLICLGELGHGAMVDYGWLTDERGRIVWSMLTAESVHAGGAYKNRMSRVVLRLPTGRYQLHYRTDGSHAPGDWNQEPPHAPEAYGISLLPATEEDRGRIRVLDEAHAEASMVLAQISAVGNGAFREQAFVLRRPMNVRIEALGEGSRETGMRDYAWLEDEERGRIIWEMRYDTSEPAGGAARNRRAWTTLLLPSGRYKLFYETDAQHAHDAWVDAPPDHPERYGVTLSTISP